MILLERIVRWLLGVLMVPKVQVLFQPLLIRFVNPKERLQVSSKPASSRWSAWRTCEDRSGVGAELAYIQALLGHESIETIQIYTQVRPLELLREHQRTHPRAKHKGSKPERAN